MKKGTKRLLTIVTIMFLLLLFLSAFSSSLPDGFEKTVELVTSVDSPDETVTINDTSIFRSMTEAALGTTIAFFVIFFLLQLLRQGREPEKADKM